MSHYLRTLSRISALLAELCESEQDTLLATLVSRPRDVAATADESAADRRKRLDRERKAMRKSAERSAAVPQNEVRNSADRSAEFRSPSLHSPSPDSENLINNFIDSRISEKNPENVTDAGAARIPVRNSAADSAHGIPHANSALALPAPVLHAGAPRDVVALREAYCEGVRAASGQGYGFPSAEEQREAFLEAVRAHAVTPDGDPARTPAEREAWLRRQTPQFVRHQKQRRLDDPAKREFYALSPKCFLAWLNATPVTSSTFPAATEATSGTRRAAEPAPVNFSDLLPRRAEGGTP